MDKLTNFDKYIKENEALVAVGFGTPASSASWSMAGLRGGDTGYSFQPVAGRVKDLAMGIAQQGLDYEGNENPNHSGVEYIKEAKNHIGDHIDETYDAMKGKDTRERVTEEYIEIINIDDALEDMLTGWDNWKNGPLTEPSDIKPAAKEFKAYITGWLNKNIK